MDQDIELTSLRPLHRNTNNANDCEEGYMAEEAIFLTQSIGEASNEEDGNTCPICLETSGILVAGECQHVVCVACVKLLLKTDKRQRLCPMCRTELVVDNLRYVSTGKPLVDEKDFQDLKKAHDNESILLFESSDPGRREVVAFSSCAAFVVVIYMLAIFLEVQLADYHEDYYNEEDFMDIPLACRAPMPLSCQANGRYQCKSVPQVPIVMDDSNDIPLNDARCETENGTFSQKYAWATVVGTGTWISASRNIPIMCDHGHPNHYTLEIYYGDCVDGIGFPNSCADDPECFFSADARRVQWLSKPDIVYSIFDGRDDNRPIRIDPDHNLMVWKMGLPSNQVCRNAIRLSPQEGWYNLKTSLSQGEKPPYSMCGLKLRRERGLFFTVLGVGYPMKATVCLPQADFFVEMSLLILEGSNCDEILNRGPGDAGCITNRTTLFTGCESVTWDTIDGVIYTLFINGGAVEDGHSSPSRGDEGGTIMISRL